MKDRIKPLIRYRIILWASAVLLTVFVGFMIFAIFSPKVFGDKRPLILVAFGLLALIFTASGAISGYMIREEKRMIYQLKVENLYTLGEATQFYNLDAFKVRVDKLSNRRSYRKRRQYILAFSPTALDISSNRGRDTLLRDLHLKISKYLVQLFKPGKNSQFDPKYNIYAFSRGIFYFCCFTNDEQYIHRLMNHISNECFRMVNEDKVKIWVQPFFGIKLVDDRFSITSSIEDALIARDHSEKNYESFTFFKDSFREETNSSSNEISKALDNNEFVPYYQPKYSLKEHRYVSSEALARWKSPEHGVLGPAKFIDQAEKAGLLNAIDTRIFELAIKDLSDDLKRGRPVLPVSVNFSLYEFFSRNFLNTIMDTLKKYQVPATLLEIEITETTSQVNKFLSLSVIKKLKSFGVRVLMDDFGSGFSQIESLRQIPFDAIKIDKSLTDKILTDEKTGSIIKYLVELGHTNNMEVIVEGAETKEQIDALRKIKVDTIQGFYYSKAIPIDEFNLLLKEQHEKGERKR